MKVPLPPPDVNTLFEKYSKKLVDILRAVTTPLVKGRYLHWDEVRRRTPPNGLDIEQWWLGLKLVRTQNYRILPLKDKHGINFVFSMPDPVMEKLHIIDTMGAGHIKAPEILSAPEVQDRFLIASLVEEAITSSQLEGAVITRKKAKEMIRYGRSPQDKSEQMILNNYLAVQKIGELKEKPLTPQAILDLHSVLTSGTLLEVESGRLQLPGEERVGVWDNVTQKELHAPPPAEQLPQRLEKLCDFANGKTKEDRFIHPLIRAILTHFQMAYDHPFADGNGRTARSLFYWVALSAGYWVLEFTSISSILKEAPARYGRSFLYTESDGNDLTYFIDYQLEVIVRAIENLEQSIKRKSAQIKEVETRLKGVSGLNHRQLALLSHALRSPDTIYTVISHRNSHRVAYNTARSDLQALVKKGFLTTRASSGRGLVYLAVNQEQWANPSNKQDEDCYRGL